MFFDIIPLTTYVWLSFEMKAVYSFHLKDLNQTRCFRHT